LFEMLAGLKINFNKSEVIMLNDEENWGKNMLRFSIVK